MELLLLGAMAIAALCESASSKPNASKKQKKTQEQKFKKRRLLARRSMVPRPQPELVTTWLVLLKCANNMGVPLR